MRTVILIALLLLLPSYVGATSVHSPKEEVQATSVEVMAEVEGRRTEFTANPKALFSFAQQKIDVLVDKDRSSRLVLGIHARSATPGDISLFGDALARNLAARYGAALLEFDGKTPMKMVSETKLPKDRGYKVATLARRVKGGEVEVDYFLRQIDGQWRVFDVHIAGFSYAMTLKSMFVEDLKTMTVAQIAAKLDKQTDRLIEKAEKDARKQSKPSA